MHTCKVSFFSGLILGIFSLSLAETTNVSNHTLQLVQMIFRHGDKNPEGCYPNDPYNNESFWPGGWNYITDKGKRRMYDLGIYFRQRYDGLISKNYFQNEMHATSTDNPRTIISAQAFLTGFYRQSNLETEWNPDFPWEPIPVRTLTKQHDRMLEVTESCPRMTEIEKECLQNDVPKYLKENQDTLDYLVTHSGVDESSVHFVIVGIQCLQIEAEQGLQLPAWSDRVLQSNLSKTLMFTHRTMHQTPEWETLRSGVLCEHLIENMEDRIGASEEEIANKIKMRIFSAHDRTLLDMMLALDIYDDSFGHPPTYGSTLIFELHREQEKYYVDVLYKNDTSSSPYKLPIPNCGIPCYIDDFKAIASGFITQDWVKDCQVGTTQLLTSSAKGSYISQDETQKNDYNSDPGLMFIEIFIFMSVLIIGGMVFLQKL